MHEVDDELGKSSIECVIRERQLLRGAEPDVDARVPGTGGLDERLRRIDRDDRIGSDPGHELRRERARPAADVEHPLSGCDPREIGELGREQHGVPSHEPVVRIGGDVEEHAARLQARPMSFASSCGHRLRPLGQGVKMPQITHVGRVMVPVADQDTAIAFYTDTLGFSLTADVPFGEGDRWVEVAPPGGGAAIALVPSQGDYPAGRMTGIALDSADPKADHAALTGRGRRRRRADGRRRRRAAAVLLPRPDANHVMIVEAQAG